MKTSKSKLLDLPAVLTALAQSVAAAGSQVQWCSANDISTAYLSEVLKGRRDPGKKILDALGLESIVLYSKKEDL